MFIWTQNEHGDPSVMVYAEAAAAIKRGDLVAPHATNKDTIEVADASDATYLGVAVADCAAGALCGFMLANDNVFIANTNASKYTDASHRYTYCDASFTSGSMGVTPGTNTSTANEIYLIGLADGQPDDTAGNTVLCMINKRLPA